MDDDTFKKELLSRLDKILELLSLSSGLSEACLVEEQEPETSIRQIAGAEQTDTTSGSGQFLMKDEMQDNYDLAMQRWKVGQRA
jgi:DNA-binding transcriptional regulator WhiA